jgi:CSLREA domain-containing protein
MCAAASSADRGVTRTTHWANGLAAALMLLASRADAATFVVDTTSDAPLSACTAAAADCSLRGAILAANAAPDADRIEFDLPPTDPGFIAATAHWRIEAASSMPNNAGDLEIDGYTQSGAVENTLAPDAGGSNAVLKVELRNAGSSQNTGIDAGSANFGARLVLRGLAISRFASQVVLVGGGAHQVEGNFLGTDITGTAASLTGNSGLGIGVRIQGEGPYRVGGEAPAARNLMSGLSSGIVSFAVPNGLRIMGNLIGTNAAGSAAIANRNYGIDLLSYRDVAIGGTTPAARNLVSGNELAAIQLGSGTAPAAFPNVRVFGNLIGTDWTGTLPIPNGRNTPSPSQPQPTILLFSSGSCSAQIGGFGPGESNLIAHGGAQGVMVGICTRASLAGNRYIGHRGLAIDTSDNSFGDGPTPIDPGDPDSGGNRQQNPPVAVDAVPSGSDAFTLSFRVDSALANATYPLRVDFYRGRGGDLVEHVGSRQVTLAEAQAVVQVVLPLSALADGVLQMLATDAEGNTSEVGRYALDPVFSNGFE